MIEFEKTPSLKTYFSSLREFAIYTDKSLEKLDGQRWWLFTWYLVPNLLFIGLITILTCWVAKTFDPAIWKVAGVIAMIDFVFVLAFGLLFGLLSLIVSPSPKVNFAHGFSIGALLSNWLTIAFPMQIFNWNAADSSTILIYLPSYISSILPDKTLADKIVKVLFLLIEIALVIVSLLILGYMLRK